MQHHASTRQAGGPATRRPAGGPAEVGTDPGEREGWASVKRGKWHRTTVDTPVRFERVYTLCGWEFNAQNVSCGFPAGVKRDVWACPACEQAHANVDGPTRPA